MGKKEEFGFVEPEKPIALMIRLDPDDDARLEAAANDFGISKHQLGRLAILNYLNGYRGPYILRQPLAEFEGFTDI